MTIIGNCTLFASLLLCLPHASYSNVIVSEILFNEVGSNVGGEWIELYNNGDTDVDLENWAIGDEETEGAMALTEAMMLFPAGTVIKARQFFIVAANAVTFENLHGFSPDVEVASGTDDDNPNVPNLTTDESWDPDGGIINLSNSQDQVLLRNNSQVEVDRIAWGPSSSQLDPNAEADGQSWFRKSLLSDTDTIDDWEMTLLDQLSTPGEGPTATEVTPPTFEARWETDDSNQRVLVWSEVPGTLFYEIRSSSDLREWRSVETVLTTTWIPPQDLEGPIFYSIITR
ncbi:MAG: hypothetical protein ACJAQT_002742 [Akkermansiaceae bacterium]|jgi:hypothetical protein